MSHEEAIGLAQILIALVLGPVFIVETSADVRIRNLVHRRLHRRAAIVTIVVTMVVIIVLVAFPSSRRFSLVEEVFAKAFTVVIIAGVTIEAFRTATMGVVELLHREIERSMRHSLLSHGVILERDLQDLIALGKHVVGDDKLAVIDVIGNVSCYLQGREA